MINIKFIDLRVALTCSIISLCAYGSQVSDIHLLSRPAELLADWRVNGQLVNVTVSAKPGYIISKSDYGVTAVGNLVFVWSERLQSRNDNDIFAQMFFVDGTKKWNTDSFPVNIFRGNQTNPKVVPSMDGGFFVVWQSDSAGKNNINIWCQRFSQDGEAVWATPIPVCAFSGNQINPVIADDIDGSILVAWEDYRRGNADIYGQRIEQDGSFTGPEDGAAIDVSAGDQTNVKFVFDNNGQPASLKWKSTRKGFSKPVVVETDISKMPIPEPGIFFLFFLVNYFLIRKA
ncbi:MAG: hypothetical protein DRI44_05360 [Chlamydiae bacterium]|nr:MAG: hypothetical protein DRI44_05360 [Chlamydiota bacterium]